jgi:hypothetical protein
MPHLYAVGTMRLELFFDKEWRRADLTRNRECTGKHCESYAGFCLTYYVTAAWFELMPVMSRAVQSAH